MAEVTEKQFVDKAAKLLDRKMTATKTIESIGELYLPQRASEVVGLVFALSDEFRQEGEYTHDSLGDEASAEALEMTAQELVRRLEKYVRDFQNGNAYRTEYELLAKYRGLHHRAYDWQYQTKPLVAKNMTDAKKLAANWRTEFAKRIRLGESDDEFKLDSVDIVVKIMDTKNNSLDNSTVNVFEDL